MLSVSGVAFEITTWVQTYLRTVLLSSLNFRRDVVVSVCAVAYEVSLGEHLIGRVRNSWLLSLSLLCHIIRLITRVSNKFSLI
jgi:hypothetical protein